MRYRVVRQSIYLTIIKDQAQQANVARAQVAASSGRIIYIHHRIRLVVKHQREHEGCVEEEGYHDQTTFGSLSEQLAVQLTKVDHNDMAYVCEFD